MVSSEVTCSIYASLYTDSYYSIVWEFYGITTSQNNCHVYSVLNSGIAGNPSDPYFKYSGQNTVSSYLDCSNIHQSKGK